MNKIVKASVVAASLLASVAHAATTFEAIWLNKQVTVTGSDTSKKDVKMIEKFIKDEGSDFLIDPYSAKWDFRKAQTLVVDNGDGSPMVFHCFVKVNARNRLNAYTGMQNIEFIGGSKFILAGDLKHQMCNSVIEAITKE